MHTPDLDILDLDILDLDILDLDTPDLQEVKQSISHGI